MALNFPNSPTLNQIYTDSTSGFSYQWNGTVWISFSASTTNNISELDNISGSFNNSTTIFPLTVGGQSVSPASTNQLLISVGGVMQNPTDDYSVSGSNIVFTTAPTNGLTFFGTLLGTAVPIGISTIGDVYNRQVYSVTGVQTSFAFPSGYTVGYLDVFRNGVRLIAGDDFTATTGNSFSLSPPAQNTDDVEAIGYKVSTIAVTEGNLIDLIVNQNATVLGITTLGAGVGAGQTALLVQGNARVTGILTVGSSSITLNGITDTINVGSGVTLSSSGINVTGVITATSFFGNLTGNVTGTITGTASTASFATTSFGLTGSPNITVTQLTATRISAGSTTGTTGQVLQSTGTGIGWTTPSGGKILQVVDFSSTSQTTVSSSSFVDTFLSASITPSNTSSKIFIIVSLSHLLNTSGGQENFLGLKRNSTDLGTFYENREADGDSRTGASISYLDSPSSTSSTTYYLQGRRASGTLTVGKTGHISSIILMEVGS
jgi:hypothetical protein